MSVNLLYNFNENSASTIRDYSTNGLDGTGTNLTVSASSRIGYDGVFNGTNAYVSRASYSGLANKTNFSIHMGIYLDEVTGTKYIAFINGLLEITWNSGTGTLSTIVYTTVSSYTVTNDVTSLSHGSYYDIDITFSQSTNELKMYVDGTAQSTITTSGNTDNVTAALYIGSTSTPSNYGKFKLNEFKIDNGTTYTSSNIDALIAEQNGVSISLTADNDMNLGDIIAANTDISTDKVYAVITFETDDKNFRIQPLQGNLRGGLQFFRVGHLWDTDRQFYFEANGTPQIVIHDSIDDVATFEAGNKIIEINKNGLFRSHVSKSADYTTTSQDQFIKVDCSGGAKTISLQNNPIDFKQITIYGTGVDETNTLTVDSFDGTHNINGAASVVLTTDYVSRTFFYNGSEWIIIHSNN